MAITDQFAEQFHLKVRKGQIHGNVILTGDPGRVKEIADRLDNPVFIASNREFTIWNGVKNNVPVTVCSTGIGAPSAAICVTELAECGAENFIRIGTCGAMQDHILPGDLIVANAAIRGDGTTLEHLPVEFPAVSDFFLTQKLFSSAPSPVHIGVVQSKDSFYSQHSPEKQPVSAHLLQRWDAYVKGNCLASEMECSAIFITAQILKLKAAAILTVIWNQVHSQAADVFLSSERAIDAAIRAYAGD